MMKQHENLGFNELDLHLSLDLMNDKTETCFLLHTSLTGSSVIFLVTVAPSAQAKLNDAAASQQTAEQPP